MELTSTTRAIGLLGRRPDRMRLRARHAILPARRSAATVV
jgi:hypothetical protein